MVKIFPFHPSQLSSGKLCVYELSFQFSSHVVAILLSWTSSFHISTIRLKLELGLSSLKLKIDFSNYLDSDVNEDDDENGVEI